MVEHQTDEEQAEALKQWLNENGKSLVVGLVVSLAAVFGYQSWQTTTIEKGEAVSVIYQDLVELVDISPLEEFTQEQESTLRHLANTLKKEHEGTSYSVFAALHLAKLAVDDHDLDAAEQELSWALDHASDEAVEHIVRQRLSRVLLSKDEPERAQEVISTAQEASYSSSYEEIKGDVYLQLDQKSKAREAYQKAMDSMVEGASSPILEMKLSDLSLAEVDAPATDTPSADTPTIEPSKSDSLPETDEGGTNP